MIFADTSFFVAAARPRDENHKRAVEIGLSLNERIITTDHVFSELVTILSTKQGNQFAYQYAVRFLESEAVVVSTEVQELPPSLEYIKRYPKLSMCDALTATSMKSLGINRILSFDSDFDDLGFERIC